MHFIHETLTLIFDIHHSNINLHHQMNQWSFKTTQLNYYVITLFPSLPYPNHPLIIIVIATFSKLTYIQPLQMTLGRHSHSEFLLFIW